MMRYLNLHTHRFIDNSNVLEVVNQYPRDFDAAIPFYSVGIHPWYIDENEVESDMQIIESKIQQDSCLAIGECGLDKRIEKSIDLQCEVFEVQLLLAQKYNKPVIVHCVAAFQELIEIKKKMSISIPMIVHGFSKNQQTAKQLLDNGLYLSFGKYLLRNPELGSVFKSVPNDRFFLETDTVEESVADVYALAAKYRNISLDALQNQIGTNFRNVFKFEL
jgi:TatD DNase family protein